MISRNIRDRFNPPPKAPPKDLPPDTPERRKWVKGLKKGDLIAVIRDGRERRSMSKVCLESNRRYVDGRGLGADGSLRPLARQYRYDKPDTTAEWVLPPTPEEVEADRRHSIIFRLRNFIWPHDYKTPCPLSTATLEALLALAEKDAQP